MSDFSYPHPHPHPHPVALMRARWAVEALCASSLTRSDCTKRGAERDGNREVDSMAEVDGT